MSAYTRLSARLRTREARSEHVQGFFATKVTPPPANAKTSIPLQQDGRAMLGICQNNHAQVILPFSDYFKGLL